MESALLGCLAFQNPFMTSKSVFLLKKIGFSSSCLLLGNLIAKYNI